MHFSSKFHECTLNSVLAVEILTKSSEDGVMSDFLSCNLPILSHF